MAQAGQNALQKIQWFEAGDHDRHAETGRDWGVFRPAHHRADMAGGEKAVDMDVRVGEQRRDRWGHQDVGDQQEEIGAALALGLQQRHRGGRRRGLEADGEEYHLACGLAAGQGQGVERRVDHAHLGATGAGGEQATVIAGYAHHVAEAA
jgi:hypothetical protein